MINLIGSFLILAIPATTAFFLAAYCWKQGWIARFTLLIFAALVSLHTHAYYFPAEPLKDRYASIVLKTSTTIYRGQ